MIYNNFSEQQVIELTNFFFDQIMGPRGLSHVVSLVSYYTTSKETEADRGIVMWVYNLITDDEFSLKLWEFFGIVLK